MAILLITLLFFSHCNNGDGTPSAALSLVGKWKMERIHFETESLKSDVSLPSTYSVAFTISEDGSYTFQDNGQEKKQIWKYDDATKKITVKSDDQTESTFDVTLTENGLNWSYLAKSIDLSKAIADEDIQTVDFLSLVALSQGKTLEGKTLKVYFVMTKI